MTTYPGSGTIIEGVISRAINVWSDGTRMSGTLFFPPNFNPKDKRPTVLLCHGWGGLSEHLNASYAPWFAGAGFVVMTFDYRGWGDSDSRLVIRGEMPKPDAKGEITVRALAVRELVDPRDQTEDIVNCINFLCGEPGVDSDRIGLWGTSYGGGNALFVTAHDERVKCLVTQVSSMDSTSILKAYKKSDTIQNVVIERARGEIEPVPQRKYQPPGMAGTPFLDRMSDYVPVSFADKIQVPVLVIDAEKESLFDIKKNGGLLYQRIKDRVPAEYKIFMGYTHVEMYNRGLSEARSMAVEWFEKHLTEG